MKLLRTGLLLLMSVTTCAAAPTKSSKLADQPKIAPVCKVEKNVPKTQIEIIKEAKQLIKKATES